MLLIITIKLEIALNFQDNMIMISLMIQIQILNKIVQIIFLIIT